MDRASGTFDPRRMSYLQDISILDDNTDFGFNERDPRWYEALEKYQQSETNLQSISQSRGYNRVQIEQRQSIYLVNSAESTKNRFSVHSFESLSDMSLSPSALILKNKKKMFKTKINESPAATLRKRTLLKANSHYTSSNSPNVSSISNENDSLESFFKKPSMTSKPPQQFFKKHKVSQNGAFVGAVERMSPEARNSEKREAMNDSFLKKVNSPDSFSKQKSKRGLLTDISNHDDSFLIENPKNSLWLSDESKNIPVAQNPTNLCNTEKELSIMQYNEKMAPKKSLFKKSQKVNDNRWMDAISYDNSENMNVSNNSLKRQSVVLEDQDVHEEPEKLSDNAPSEESEICLNASRRSSVSEINYEKFKQLASSTVIGSEMSPKVPHLRKSMKYLSRKSSVMDFLDDIEEHDTQNVTLNQENVDSLNPIEEDIPLQLVENNDRINSELNNLKSVKTSSINYSHEKADMNKENSLHNTKEDNVNIEIAMAELSSAKEKSTRKSSEEIKMTSVTEKLPEINIADSPKNELQAQSPNLSKIIQDLSASEKSSRTSSTQLNQSEIDRAVIEEMKNKRTNPPVRRSTVILQQNPLILDENSNDDIIVDEKQPLRHSNIPILPLNMNDNFNKNQSGKHSNIELLSNESYSENIEIDNIVELQRQIYQSSAIHNSQKFSELNDEVSQSKTKQDNNVSEHRVNDKDEEVSTIDENNMENNAIMELQQDNEKLHESNTEIFENKENSLANQNHENSSIEVKDNDKVESLSNIEQEKVSMLNKENIVVINKEDSNIIVSENINISHIASINLNDSKQKDNTNINLNSSTMFEGNNKNRTELNPNFENSALQKSIPEIQAILSNSKINNSVSQLDMDPANITLKADNVNTKTLIEENTSEIFDDALEKSENKNGAKILDGTSNENMITFQNKNMSRYTDLDMELTIFDVPNKEFELQKNNGNTNHTVEFSLDSLENVPVLSNFKKSSIESVIENKKENLLNSCTNSSDSESDESGNVSLNVSEHSIDSESSDCTLKSNHEDDSDSHILKDINKENINSSSERRNKKNNIIPASMNQNKKIYDEERMLQLKEILKKSMEEKIKQADLAVQKMFELQKNIKDITSLKTPWNLLDDHKKPIAKSLKLKKQGLPNKKITKENKKLYMKERWITKRLYDFIQKKLEPKHGFFTLAKSEEFIINLAKTINITLKKKDYYSHVLALKTDMANLGIVKTHHDFHEFIRNYLPFHFRIRAIPALGRDIPDINGGLFDNILAEN